MEKAVFMKTKNPSLYTSDLLFTHSLVHPYRVQVPKGYESIQIVRLPYGPHESEFAPSAEAIIFEKQWRNWYVIDVACYLHYFIVLLRSSTKRNVTGSPNVTNYIYEVRSYSYESVLEDVTNAQTFLLSKTQWDACPAHAMVLYCRLSTTLESQKPLLYWTPTNWLDGDAHYDPDRQIHVLDAWVVPEYSTQQASDWRRVNVDRSFLLELSKTFALSDSSNYQDILRPQIRRFALQCFDEYDRRSAERLENKSLEPFPAAPLLLVYLFRWVVWLEAQEKGILDQVGYHYDLDILDWSKFVWSMAFKQSQAAFEATYGKNATALQLDERTAEGRAYMDAKMSFHTVGEVEQLLFGYREPDRSGRVAPLVDLVRLDQQTK
jgi:hypothetical protein